MPANTSHKIYTLNPRAWSLSKLHRNKEPSKLQGWKNTLLISMLFYKLKKRITIKKDLVDINITIKIQFSVLVSPAACKLPFQNSGLTTSCGIKISNWSPLDPEYITALFSLFFNTHIISRPRRTETSWLRFLVQHRQARWLHLLWSTQDFMSMSRSVSWRTTTGSVILSVLIVSRAFLHSKCAMLY